jgi:hypothetical protein
MKEAMKRPRGITLLGALILIEGLLFALGGSLTLAFFLLRRFADPELQLPSFDLTSLIRHPVIGPSAFLVLGAFGVVGGIGVLQLRSWAWLLAMITQGVTLAIGISAYLRGTRDPLLFIGLLFGALIVFALNRRDTQSIFRLAQRRADPTGSSTATDARLAVEEAEGELGAS